jgi:c-di-GMP phosphodiesterase
MQQPKAASAGIWIARQPLYDRNLNTAAYELLLQPYTPTALISLDDPIAVQALMDTFTNTGLERLVGNKKALIPATRTLLLSIPSNVLPPDRVILAVNEEIASDERLMERLSALNQFGYQVAISSVRAATGQLARLAGMGQLISVPLNLVDPLRAPAVVNQLRLYHARLTAKGINTLDEMNICKRLGFDYVQGNFLFQPRRAYVRRADASRIAVMRTLAKIQDPRADFRGLGDMISQDTFLSQKLLAVVNSPTYNLGRTINTLDQAVAYLGLKQLRGMLTMLTMASVPGKPPEMTTIAMLRARMCELLAPAFGQQAADILFVTGLFSLLDALLDMPMSEAISGLPLSPEVITALVEGRGPAAIALSIALAMENANWEGLARCGLNPDMISSAYLQALRWSVEISSSLEAG